jgi:hypothetical protein
MLCKALATVSGSSVRGITLRSFQCAKHTTGSLSIIRLLMRIAMVGDLRFGRYFASCAR